MTTFKYRLYNCTTQEWVMDELGRVREFDSPGDAYEALDRVKQIPGHDNDFISITTVGR